MADHLGYEKGAMLTKRGARVDISTLVAVVINQIPEKISIGYFPRVLRLFKQIRPTACNRFYEKLALVSSPAHVWVLLEALRDMSI